MLEISGENASAETGWFLSTVLRVYGMSPLSKHTFPSLYVTNTIVHLKCDIPIVSSRFGPALVHSRNVKKTPSYFLFLKTATLDFGIKDSASSTISPY